MIVVQMQFVSISWKKQFHMTNLVTVNGITAVTSILINAAECGRMIDKPVVLTTKKLISIQKRTQWTNGQLHVANHGSLLEPVPIRLQLTNITPVTVIS